MSEHLDRKNPSCLIASRMSYLIKFRNEKHLPASIACDEVSWARICIFEEKLHGILLWSICDVSVKYLVEKELQRTS